MTHPFKGAGVALATPFKEDFSIDFNALEDLVEDQISNGMDYLVALGTTAETPTLSLEEQKEVVACIKSKINKRVPLVLGMGGNDPYKIIKSIEETDFTDVDGILSVTPYYNKPSQKGLVEHYKLVCKASPVSVILYNVPSRTGVNMKGRTSVEIAEACPNAVAIKEASGISSQVARMAKHGPDHFAVISGDDLLALPVIAVGGIGVISVAANALPGKLSQLIHLANDGKFIEARELHLQMIDFFKLLFREGNPGGIKAAMEIAGKAKNVVRLPIYPISQKLYADLEKEMATLL
ncbi:4-hydroxy-tetrahydrodipicolinate synthase [Sunxiuqinia elliptica]|uniref:4-hydroxy-tetrahydrodipicolinate synthase n=1 Tax=Sunxiuqinia elliptica TaxID=655355 RepID=A0A4V3BXU9_9BACT|nr:4-hydroxy-tetrahydrodipicolinate synthase [Sunxiuqinia elliptica]TDN99838.1 dihydrodipicolinate synthase [Sunxiuqinia elliptica]TDO57030.1 dihydrodipicolinate synthase [Sunxiuqinia elliptica]